MATKHAIARKQLDALNRVEESMLQISERLNVDRLDMKSIRHRDPAFQQASRFEYLANWCESLAVSLEQSNINLSSAAVASASLEVVRKVLNLGLNNMTKKELDTFIEDELGISNFRGHLKQESVNRIIAALTDLPLEVDDVPEEEPEPEEAEIEVIEVDDEEDDLFDLYNEDVDEFDVFDLGEEVED